MCTSFNDQISDKTEGLIFLKFHKGWVNDAPFIVYRAILTKDSSKISAGYSIRLYHEDVDTEEITYIDAEPYDTEVDW